jgi:hypothetical protein
MDDQPQLKPGPKEVGRPPKPGGPRKHLHAEVPAPLLALLKQDAKAEKVPLCDRLAEILASHYSAQEAMPKAS